MCARDDVRYVCELSEETKLYAKEHLNETDENRGRCISEVRDWIVGSEEFVGRSDDLFILAFLRGCKYDMERVKRKLLNYYKLRLEMPHWFSERDVANRTILDLVRMGVFVPLQVSHENRLVIIIRTSIFNAKKYSINDVVKAGLMLLDIWARECEFAQIYGITAIFDMTNVSLAHARQLTPHIIKGICHLFDNYHVRPKLMEFIFAPFYINVVLNVFRSFMSEKLRNRIRVHFNGIDTLYQHVDKRILPVEYGGDGRSIAKDIDHCLAKLNEYGNWLRNDEKYCFIVKDT